MPYSATAYRLLISSPSDVLDEDIAIVTAATARWNAIYGQQFGAVIVPTRWAMHSAAEHGVRPQESLNAQLVDAADLVIAIFWHRLGSPTGEAESGTLEEIERAVDNGAYVAILRCRRDLPPAAVDPAQLQRLNAFYSRVQPRSLMLDYADEANLAAHLDTILSWAVTKSGTRAELSTEAPRSRRAEVWPRVESNETVRTDSKGRVRTQRHWALVLSNTGAEPARNVRHRLEEEGSGEAMSLELEEPRELEVLAPGGRSVLLPGFAHGRGRPGAVRRELGGFNRTARECRNIALLLNAMTCPRLMVKGRDRTNLLDGLSGWWLRRCAGAARAVLHERGSPALQGAVDRPVPGARP